MAQRGAPKSSKKPAKKKAAGKGPARKAAAGKRKSQASLAQGAGDAASSLNKTAKQVVRSKASSSAGPASGSNLVPGSGGGGSARSQHALVTQDAQNGHSAQDLALECTRLKAELKKAREEIKDLKGRQDYVLNRIDWAIDSLHSLLEENE